MFFHISKTAQDNFSTFYKIGNLVVSTDPGWKRYETQDFSCVFKGYADDVHLEKSIADIIMDKQLRYTGNFCVIVHEKNTGRTSIRSDLYRGFPIYVTDGKCVTNLCPAGRTFWTDSIISMTDNLDIDETKIDVIGAIDTSPIDKKQAVLDIASILKNKTQKWLQHNILPIKVFLSGGVDSLLVYSVLQGLTDQYEFVKCSHVEYDRFWLKNSHTLTENYWGYKQIHHWIDPCVLTSGAPGDEFMMRSPTTVDQLLKYHDMDIRHLLEQGRWKNSLHSDYFALPKHQKLFRDQAVDRSVSVAKFHWSLCNIIVNDWQHWHIGNTLTWTPLRDLAIFKILLRLPIGDLLPQIFDSALSCQLIEKNRPGLTSVISDKKNIGNYMSHLSDFYLQHASQPGAMVCD